MSPLWNVIANALVGISGFVLFAWYAPWQMSVGLYTLMWANNYGLRKLLRLKG